jgi:selenide,water dikinase
MVRLNRVAGHAARDQGAHAATDITGYGLLGHALEMADAAGVQFEFTWDALHFLPGALGYAEQWIFAGGAETNASAARDRVQFAPALNDWQRMLLFDPQTSGGLLVALPPARASLLVSAVQAQGEDAWVVGRVQDGAGIVVG